MDNPHKLYLGIPLNVPDLIDPGSSGLRYEDIRFEDTELTPREYDLLFDLFTEFNHAFDIIIDAYEEEIIRASQIDKAISLAEEYGKHGSTERKTATAKLLLVLKRAKELCRPISLAF